MADELNSFELFIFEEGISFELAPDSTYFILSVVGPTSCGVLCTLNFVMLSLRESIELCCFFAGVAGSFFFEDFKDAKLPGVIKSLERSFFCM